MSGGSFDYLYRSPWPQASYDKLDRMAGWLLRHHMKDAAAATVDASAHPPSLELRGLWKAVEWFESSDWSLQDVLAAYNKWEREQ